MYNHRTYRIHVMNKIYKNTTTIISSRVFCYFDIIDFVILSFLKIDLIDFFEASDDGNAYQ